jgi:hypothetical protein
MSTRIATDRRLMSAWGLLVGLTVISLAATLGYGGSEAGLPAAAIALAASYLKARAVLYDFLDLRHAAPGWRAFFSAMLVVVLGGLMATYVAAVCG